MTLEDRQEIARQLTAYFPKKIIEELTRDRAFRQQNDIHSVATLSLPGVDGAFARNEFLAAVGRAFRPGSAPETVADKQGRQWEIAWSDEAGWPLMKKGDQVVALAAVWFVSTDDVTRRAMLERVFRENRAVGPDFDRWREMLTAGPIDVEDIESFHEDMERTPTQIVLGIREGMHAGSSEQHTLTPPGRHYYERLVGSAAGVDTVTAFAEGPAKAHIAALVQWNADEGLRQALLLGAHSGLVPSLPDGFDPVVIERVIVWASKRGDRISQLSALELGLHHLTTIPTLLPALTSIVEQIRDDRADDPNGRLLLLSNLFLFVDGSLAHMGHLRDVPPFWRRLAALAQASMIEREFVAGRVDAESTNAWLRTGRGTPFYLKNSIDGRLEPRWLPDFANPGQWKVELVSRVVGALERNTAAIAGTPLEALLRSTEEGSLRSQFLFPFAFMPGPLEGGLDQMIDPPAEFEEAIRESVTVGPPSPGAFNALVNTCLIFRTPPELAQKAAEGIKAAKYRMRVNDQAGQNFAMLSGLAMVAAVTRSHDLAREVRVLTRLAVRRVGSDFDLIQSFRIGLIAANAFADLYEWRSFAGEWVTELAFSDLDKDTALTLHGLVEILCDLEPALWATLSKADAALTAFINSMQAT